MHIRYFGDHKMISHHTSVIKSCFFEAINRMMELYYGIPKPMKNATEKRQVPLPFDHPMHTIEWKKGIKEEEEEFMELHTLFRTQNEPVKYILQTSCTQKTQLHRSHTRNTDWASRCDGLDR